LFSSIGCVGTDLSCASGHRTTLLQKPRHARERLSVTPRSRASRAVRDAYCAEVNDRRVGHGRVLIPYGRIGPYPVRMGAGTLRAAKTGRVVGLQSFSSAKVAELADAPDLGSGSRKAMGVRLPPFAFREGSGRMAQDSGSCCPGLRPTRVLNLLSPEP
jgi:hypothetical protein